LQISGVTLRAERRSMEENERGWTIMHQVQLSDQLYQEAQRRAAEAGFGSVDDYIADVLTHDFDDQAEDLDRFFTPERLAQVDRAAAQIKAGELFTSKQVREHFEQKRKA
jgi:hypothetical protein